MSSTKNNDVFSLPCPSCAQNSTCMDSEIIAAWISDQHILLHACSDPATCPLPLEYSTVSPPLKRKRGRQRVPLRDMDPNHEHNMAGPRRSARKPKKPPTQEDPFVSHPVDADTDADPQATPRNRALPLLPQTIFPPPRPTFVSKLSENDQRSLPSRPASPERSSRASTRTRSTSPVKNIEDLLKLEKPVLWTVQDPRTLRDTVKATGNPQALGLFNNIWSVVRGDGYLPRELKGILEDELMVTNSCFAREDRVLVTTPQKEADVRQLFSSLGPSTNNDELLRLLTLYNELESIRAIVATTQLFVNASRPEATWNDHIHGPILRLAVSSTKHVAAENITHASIAERFIPASRAELKTLGGKMVDYTMLLRPGKDLTFRIMDLVDNLDGPTTFNQSTHVPLVYSPSAVFIETKIDTRRRPEAKAQLGIWLAAWFDRVAQFAPSKLPFLPVLLVVCESWELYFAFDQETEFEVLGPLDIGSTADVDGAYRLLGVLRLLAGWVGGEFREWVESCVG